MKFTSSNNEIFIIEVVKVIEDSKDYIYYLQTLNIKVKKEINITPVKKSKDADIIAYYGGTTSYFYPIDNNEILWGHYHNEEASFPELKEFCDRYVKFIAFQ